MKTTSDFPSMVNNTASHETFFKLATKKIAQGWQLGTGQILIVWIFKYLYQSKNLVVRIFRLFPKQGVCLLNCLFVFPHSLKPFSKKSTLLFYIFVILNSGIIISQAIIYLIITTLGLIVSLFIFNAKSFCILHLWHDFYDYL